jgi:hypothetical protein
MSTIASSSGLGFLVADGHQVAIGFPHVAGQESSVYLVSDCFPTEISVDRRYFTSTGLNHGFGFRRDYFGQPEVTITLKGSGLERVSLEEGVNLFRNVNSLSVNELLAIAYQKMKSRQS